ncbi:cell division protein FtsQ/DivIB [Acuticoccus sp.]|uniref:cell division protein FtsQ/DivIB n=1 Tax=Acuticoccus sp. TaxID=1904378 RepID=UPI003B519D1F
MPALTSRALRSRLAGPLPTRLLTAAVLVGTCGAGLAYAPDPGEAIDAVARFGGFEVRYVKLAGQKETSDSAIVASVGLEPDGTLLSVDVEAMRQRLEALPWVTRATVRKVLPGTLDVTIDEASAFARWRIDGSEVLIADDGTVLADEVPPRFAELPLVAGRGANHAVRDAREVLSSSPLYEIRTRAAILINERRWDLVFDTGATVRLPEDGAAEALQRLADIEAQGTITLEPIVVDMRLADRTVIELDPQADSELYVASDGTRDASEEPADLLAAAIAEAAGAAPIDPLAAAIVEAQR